MKTELLGTKDCIIRLDFKELEDKGYASVTDYCRVLVKDFGYQTGTLENTTIEVYRGEMLCLTVKNIKEAATLQPSDSGWRKVKKDRARRLAQPRTEV